MQTRLLCNHACVYIHSSLRLIYSRVEQITHILEIIVLCGQRLLESRATFGNISLVAHVHW